MPDQGTCRSCGAKILWVDNVRPRGKKNPLSLEPTDLECGNVLIQGDGRARGAGTGWVGEPL
jgi:hypothetical protein